MVQVWTERIGGAQWRVLVDVPGKALMIWGPYSKANAEAVAARLARQFEAEQGTAAAEARAATAQGALFERKAAG